MIWLYRRCDRERERCFFLQNWCYRIVYKGTLGWHELEGVNLLFFLSRCIIYAVYKDDLETVKSAAILF